MKEITLRIWQKDGLYFMEKSDERLNRIRTYTDKMLLKRDILSLYEEYEKMTVIRCE